MSEASQTVHDRTPLPSLLPAWRAAFLSALRENGVVRYACEAVQIGRQTAYDARTADPEFAAAWERALEDAADLLEQEAVRRARIGVREPVIYQGHLCGQWVTEDGEVVAENTPGSKLVPLGVTKYSDGLLMFLLKGMRSDKYRDKPPELPPLEVLLAALPSEVAETVRAALAESVRLRRDRGGGATGGS